MSPLIPVIVGAVAETVRHAVSKDNLKSGTTKAAAIVATGAAANVGVNPPQTVEEVVFNAVLAVTALILFFYRKRNEK